MIALAVWAVALAGAASLGTSLVSASIASRVQSRAHGSRRVHPRARAGLWLGVALAPALVGVLLIAAVLAPRAWLGLADHCPSHLHHLHLCVRHGAPWPPAIVVAFAAAWAARVVGLWTQGVVDAWRADRGRRRLGSAGDVVRLPLPGALAFTAGWLAPRVYATAAVLDDPSWSAVLAHERDHARHRDPLARLVARFALACHAPLVASWLERQLVAAQELAADDAAATRLGDRVEVARQLVAWAATERRRPMGAGFEQGDVQGRVRVLLDAPRYRPGPSSRALLTLGVCVACAAAALADPIHHAVETALGALGA